MTSESRARCVLRYGRGPSRLEGGDMQLIEPRPSDCAAHCLSAAAGEHPSIVVYDSGVGGLSVAKHVVQLLPDYDLIYLADNGWFPYGNKPEPVLRRRVNALLDELNHVVRPAGIMVACNTASTAIPDRLGIQSLIPLQGVLPPLREAMDLSLSGNIALFATPGTLQRETIRQALDVIASGKVIPFGSLDLVYAAERKLAGESIDPSALARHFDDQWLNAFQRSVIDVVILGCTHFPHLQEELAIVLPGVRHWVDPAALAALALATKIRRRAPPPSRRGPSRRRLLLTSSHNSAELLEVFTLSGFFDCGQREVA